jgi:hypothetical protein
MKKTFRKWMNKRFGKWFRVQFSKYVQKDEIFKANIIKGWQTVASLLIGIVFLASFGVENILLRYPPDTIGRYGAFITVLFGFANAITPFYFSQLDLRRRHEHYLLIRNRRSARKECKPV